jgi:hypothetical protein
VYGGAGAEAGLHSNIQVPDNLKSTKIVIELCEPLMNNGYCLLMDNYYNSPSFCLLLSNMGISVAGMLRLNGKMSQAFALTIASKNTIQKPVFRIGPILQQCA